MPIINTNSPLQLDIPMAEGLIEMARAGQAVCVTPFTLAGAMGPATLAGTLTLQNAENLAVLALTQIVRPGAPAIYGAFTSNVDMRSGSPAFGTPEYAKAAQASGQLARRYGLPLRSSNVTSSNVVDAQSTYESAMSLWATITGHANIIVHAAGWLEGGLTIGYEKFVMDLDHCGMMVRMLDGLAIDAEGLAAEAYREAGPGVAFLGTAHTLAHFETANYLSDLADTTSYEQWAEDGRLDLERRANRRWKEMLADYEAPPLDPAVDEALQDFMARKKLSAPDQWH